MMTTSPGAPFTAKSDTSQDQNPPEGGGGTGRGGVGGTGAGVGVVDMAWRSRRWTTVPAHGRRAAARTVLSGDSPVNRLSFYQNAARAAPRGREKAHGPPREWPKQPAQAAPRSGESSPPLRGGMPDRRGAA